MTSSCSENKAPPKWSGFWSVAKPCGLTSHQVVSKVRRALGVTQVGHAGTLDPFAGGVLPVGVGRATKAIDNLVNAKKVYDFSLRLGVTTDTLDVTGRVTEEKIVPSDYLIRLPGVLSQFLGSYSQIPPAFSALKSAGVPLYKLARQGRNVTDLVNAKERVVFIYDLSVLAHGWPHHGLTSSVPQGSPSLALGNESLQSSMGESLGKGPLICLRVECGKGTYVRALCRDIALHLGTVGYCEQLVRVQVGPFCLDKSTDFEDLSKDVFLKTAYPVEDIVLQFPVVDLDTQPRLSEPLNHGRSISLSFQDEIGVRAPHSRERLTLRALVSLILNGDANEFGASAANGSSKCMQKILVRTEQGLILSDLVIEKQKNDIPESFVIQPQKHLR